MAKEVEVAVTVLVVEVDLKADMGMEEAAVEVGEEKVKEMVVEDFLEVEDLAKEVLAVREVKVEMEAEVQATVVLVEVDLMADTGMEEKAMVKGED